MHPINKKPDSPKNKGGRPPKQIDLEIVEKLGQIHCTDEEIAAVVGVSSDTFKRRKHDENFAEMLDEARRKGKASLRRMQFAAAQNGSIPMLIFLGKNLLGQRDRFDDVVGDKDPMPWQD